MRCLIIGSCVTRDAFEYNEILKKNMVGYYARTSFATLAPINVHTNTNCYYQNYDKINALSSSFQIRMLESDFQNGVLKAVTEREYDRIIIDLIDERFNLAVIGGRLVTASSEFSLAKIRIDEIIESFSDECYELWQQGMGHFLDILRDCRVLDKVLINKVYWSYKTQDEEVIDPSKFSTYTINKYNFKMEKMYNFLLNYFDDRQFINFDEQIMRSDKEHKWGLAPFHYCDSYYQSLAQQILFSSDLNR